MLFGIVHPEVVALRAGLAQTGAANSLHPFEQRRIPECRGTQLGPVAPFATGYHIIDAGQREALVVKVSVLHRRMPDDEALPAESSLSRSGVAWPALSGRGSKGVRSSILRGAARSQPRRMNSAAR